MAPKLGAVIVLAVALAADASAQRATASLTPVESGRIAAGSEADYREMCLRQGLYVLAFQLGGGSWGAGVVGLAGESDPVAVVSLSDSDQDRWAWKSFEVDDYTCFRLAAQNGRARVYLVRVGVNW